jgi:putative ABC transport system ATP-binding protein
MEFHYRAKLDFSEQREPDVAEPPAVAILKEVALEIVVPGGRHRLSGSGKTSLLMVIAGLERATSGTVVVAGHDFSRLDEDRLAACAANIGIASSVPLVPP